jgi:predicted DCC family thiol-disulfide oxidoreductase YuxK
LPASKISSNASAELQQGHAWLLYDGGCGICKVITARILDLDRAGRLHPVRLQDPKAAVLLPNLTEEDRLKSFHLVERDGTIHSAGEGLTKLFDYLPAGAPIRKLAGRFGGATDRFYWLIAGNRTALGRRIPAHVKAQAERRIAART